MAGGNANGKGWTWFILTLVSGLFFAAFHNFYVTKDFVPLRFDTLSERENPALARTPELLVKEKFAKNGSEAMVLWLDGAGSPIPFHIEDPETLRGKVKAFFPKMAGKTPVLKVYANGVEADAIKPDWGGSIGLVEFDIQGKFLKAGENAITLKAEGAEGIRLGYDSIALKNFVGISKRFPKAFVVFDGNYPVTKKIKKPFSFLLYPSLMFILWLAGGNLIHYAYGTQLGRSLRTVFLWQIPIIAGFIGSAAFSYFSNYLIIYEPRSFFILIMLPSSAIIAYSLLRLMLKALLALWRKATLQGVFDKMMEIKGPLNRFGKGFFGFKSLVRRASTLAVFAFIICLSTAGFLLIIKRQYMAERMADIAYFSLVFGVLLRIFDLKKEEE